MLPAGSRYMAALHPRAEWGRDTNLIADIVDALLTISWQIGHAEGADEPLHVVRPWEAREREEARAKSKRVMETILNTRWEEV